MGTAQDAQVLGIEHSWMSLFQHQSICTVLKLFDGRKIMHDDVYGFTRIHENGAIYGNKVKLTFGEEQYSTCSKIPICVFRIAFTGVRGTDITSEEDQKSTRGK